MSQKRLDNKNRWRSKTVGFRVSPEEWAELERKVRLCGYQKKQEYITDCLFHHKVTATGNPLMFIQFKKELKMIHEELLRIDNASEVSGDLIETVHTMLEILEAFGKNE